MNAETPTLDEMRPLLHQHMVLLTAGGMPPGQALAVAAETAMIVHDDGLVTEALSRARHSLARSDDRFAIGAEADHE